MKKKIIIFIGTAAELIKLVPVIKKLDNYSIDYEIVASGQTELKETELHEIINISVKTRIIKNPKKISSVFLFILWFVKCLFFSLQYFRNIKPNVSLVVIHGDTVSSLIGAICSKLSSIKVVHVESGLRSFNFFEPFPEEISRFLVSKISDLHFCPNEWALKNIQKEYGEKINTLQNTSYETMQLAKCLNKLSPQIEKIKTKYFLTIIHRQENIYFKKSFVRNLIKKITSFANKVLKCVLVLHNITEKFLKDEGILDSLKNNTNVVLLPRTPYIEFITTISKAEFMLTDGGSNQEEAFYLGVPTLILRNCTERIEGLSKNVFLMKGKFKKLDVFLSTYSSFKGRESNEKATASEIIIKKILELREL